MKKIALCSLLMCFGVIVASAATNSGATCRWDASGRKVVCAYVDVGADIEHKLCYNNDNTEKPAGTDCTSGSPGAAKAVCQKNKQTSSSASKMSCTARECKSDYLLYTTNTRQEIEVIGQNRKVGSQGICRAKSFLKQKCDEGCGCAADEKCVLNEVKVRNFDKTIAAFIGEEMCVCEKKAEQEQTEVDNTCPEKLLEVEGVKVDGDNSEPSGCVFKFNGKFRCKAKDSDNEIKRELKAEIDLTEGQLAEFGGKCPDLKQKTEAFNKLYAIYKNALLKWAENCCEEKPKDFENGWSFTKVSSGNGGGSYSATNYEVIEAQNRLKSFFDYADANRSVWRNAEGKFNTARLASDLTAGVVLGTVGGVVSGVVIKKKQVEKGFDALQCTVGGQKVADWGDQFTVGLQR